MALFFNDYVLFYVLQLVQKSDQLFPLFVMQVMGDIPCIPGQLSLMTFIKHQHILFLNKKYQNLIAFISSDGVINHDG